MFCENCGTKLADGAKFCSGCGAMTEPQQSSQAAAAAAEQIPMYPDTIQTPPVHQPVQTQPQPAYTPPQQTVYPAQQIAGTEPLRVIQYIGMFLLMCVPILNIILLFVWSFGGKANINKRNYARACLIMCLIAIVIYIVVGAAIWGFVANMLGGMNSQGLY